MVDGNYDPITFYVHRAMSPEKYHYRLPFFAPVLSPTNVSFNGDLKAIMD